MAFYIIIRGPAGVGKTTVSKKLSKKLKAHYISFDSLLKKHKLDYILGRPCIPPHNFIKINKIVAPESKKRLEKGQILIFEGTCYHKSTIKDLIQRLSFKHFIFTLKADREECVKRDKKRKSMGKKRIYDVHKLVTKFDTGIIINTNNKSTLKIVKEIQSHLPFATLTKDF